LEKLLNKRDIRQPYIIIVDIYIIILYNYNVLDLLVKSAVRRKILGLFAINDPLELYSREVALAIGESPHAVGLELKYLSQGGLIRRIERAGRAFYAWNDEYPFAPEIKSTIIKMLDLGDEEISSLPDLKQRALIGENVKRIVRDIKRFYDPEKIIMFGSAATGRVRKYSDIDLVVVKKTALPFFKRSQKLVDLLDYNVDVDILVYTPEEFENAVKEKRFFSEEIVKKGRVLYDKAS